MAETISQLRVFCICGQKMKVTEKMYGLPGKCIACKQKIRIPQRRDIPEGTNEVHLKDHPEFLRGPKRSAEDIASEKAARSALEQAPARPGQVEGDSTPNTELDLVDGGTPAEARASRSKKGGTAGSVPLDILDPLRKLCSLQYKLARQLDMLDKNRDEDRTTYAEIEGHLTRVGKLRMRLDDHLHQLLMEVAIELTNTQEKIAQSRLAARVGEIGYGEYHDTIFRLRSRRDRLERRQQNIRGWLAIHNPHQAGGFLDLSIESIPADEELFVFPPDPDDSQPLLSLHSTGLREALEDRSGAERKLAEAERMAKGDTQPHALDDVRSECKWDKRRAQANIAFHRNRLERLQKDFATDLESANAQLEVARGRLRSDEMTRSEFDAIEKGLIRAKKDLAKGQTVVARALSSNVSGDVPAPHGTFMERLGFGADKDLEPDKVIAWAASALLCLSIFLPSIGDTSLVRGYIEFQGLAGAASWLFLGPLAVAIAISGITALPDARVRGILTLIVWVLSLVAGAYIVNIGQYSLNPMAAQFRSGLTWLVRPGILLSIFGSVGIAASAAVALWSEEKLRVGFSIVLAVGVLAASGLLGLFSSANRQLPEVEVLLGNYVDGTRQEGQFTIRNTSGKELYLLSRPSSARGTYVIAVERRAGENSWPDISGSVLKDRPMGGADAGLLYTVEPHRTLDVLFELPPGEYQVLLHSRSRNEKIVQQFTIEDPAPAGAAAPGPSTGAGNAVATVDTERATSEEQTAASSEPPEFQPEAPPEPGEVLIAELNGIMTAPDGSTRFSFMTSAPDGDKTRHMLSLEDTVWGDWTVSEYNPEMNTVTLQGDGKILILRRGDRVELTR